MRESGFFDTLPEGFTLIKEYDLRKNPKAILALNGLGLALFVITGILLQIYLSFVRPSGHEVTSFSVSNMGQVVLIVLLLILDVALILFLHEGVHGYCFWRITGKRPVFSIGPGYAAAASPEVFIRRGPYLITALAPLIFLTSVGIIILPFIPTGWVFHVGLIVVMNISGSVGDLWVALGLARLPASVLIQDMGDKVLVFKPTKNSI
jgi:hypothetical protein